MTLNNSSFLFPEVKLVQASAGSGKTYQLTKRYVQLLLLTCRKDPSALKEVLAITFTNKAAQEMKARILEFLKKTSLGQLQDWEIADVLVPVDLTPKAAAVLATNLMDYILRSYHYFAVQTIDSFINTLLAGCAFKIGLSAKFRIARNSYDYLQLGLDELITDAMKDKQTRQLFDSFIKQYLFLENRGSWLPKEELLKTISTLYAQANTYGLPLVQSVHDIEGLRADKNKLYDILAHIHVQAPQGMRKQFADSLAKFVTQSSNGFDVDELSDYLARPEFPSLKDAAIPGNIHDQWSEARQLLNEICLQEAFGVFNPYIQIYTKVMVSFARLQSKDDVLFLEQLNQKARALFDDDLVTVGELYYRLAARFRHYLIDEFQDTNRAQWSNLRLMIEESLSSDGSLFLVGDAKQAIYGFRGGDSRLFDTIAEDYKSLVSFQSLEVNRRSQRRIVEFNNQIFGRDNLVNFLQAMRGKTDAVIAEGDEEHFLYVFANVKQEWRDTHPYGCVRVLAISGKSDEREAAIHQQFFDCLTDVRQRFSLGDIAVLVRSNTQVELVTGWLMHEGIAVESERTSDIKRHPLVAEILAFLKFLYNPTDDIAFTTFLLGKIAPRAFQVSHEDLASFCFKHRTHIPDGFRHAYPMIWESFINGLINHIGHYPLYELMVNIYRSLSIQENFPESLGFLMHLLEVIKRKEEDSVDVGTFLENFERLEDEFRFIPVPKADAVRVLTVHKAKGLEFPVVILPFLEMPLKVGAGGKEGHQSFSLLMDDKGLSLVRLKKSYAQFSPALKGLWDHEFKKSLLNELCAMYVALTRAVWEMHVFIPEKSGNAFNPALMLVPEDQWQRGDKQLPERISKDILGTSSLLTSLPLSDWMPLLREDFGEDARAARQARLKGEVWHQALAYIQRITPDDEVSQWARESLRKVYVQRGLLMDHFNDEARLLTDFLERADVRPFFNIPLSAYVLCEFDIVNRYGDLQRLDRLMVSHDKVSVIDFKTSQQGREQHQQQIDTYIESLKAIYPKHSIEGHLVYFDKGVR